MWENPAIAPFKALKTEAAWARGFLYLAAAFYAAYGLLLLVLYVDGAAVFDYFEEVAFLESASPFLSLGVFIAFVVWAFSAHQNLVFLGRQGVRHSNQAAIWWWLLPVANLFMPFRVMFETFRGSLAPSGLKSWRTSPLPKEAGAWTGLLIGGRLFELVGAALVEDAVTFDEFETGLLVSVAASGALVAAAILAAKLVAATTEGQRALAETVPSSSGVTGLEAPAVAAPPRTSTQDRSEPGAGTSEAGSGEAGSYCTNCGVAFRSGDRFCGTCGHSR